jgi:hypothetical protein
MAKKKNIYTTIQITKKLNKHIKLFCEEHELLTSKLTETFWSNLISSSMTGSIVT